MKVIIAKSVFILIIITALIGYLNSPSALLLGFIFALIFSHPYKEKSQVSISYLLKIAVVGLGFGMYLKQTLETGKEGLSLTFFSIIITLGLGTLLARALKIDLKLGHLITSGTAICGGSAIAAIAPVIKADSKTISISLGIVFLLNSIALFIFPPLGHFLNLTQEQFGLWCAVAIHDTSSVVGASLGYGDEALRIATTVKLSRTLWIIPLSVLSLIMFKTKGEKIKIPYFIGLFILAILINSAALLPKMVTDTIILLSKRFLIVTLFLVGASINFKDIKNTGFRPILLAVILWVAISVFALVYILNF